MITAQGLKNYVDKYNHAHVNVNDQSDDKLVPFMVSNLFDIYPTNRLDHRLDLYQGAIK